MQICFPNKEFVEAKMKLLVIDHEENVDMVTMKKILPSSLEIIGLYCDVLSFVMFKPDH